MRPFALAIGLALLMQVGVSSATVADGVRAYNEGRHEMAFGEFMHWARKNKPDGLYWAGRMLVEGVGTEPHPKRGMSMVEKAALAGNKEAAAYVLSKTGKPVAKRAAAKEVAQVGFPQLSYDKTPSLSDPLPVAAAKVDTPPVVVSEKSAVKVVEQKAVETKVAVKSTDDVPAERRASEKDLVAATALTSTELPQLPETKGKASVGVRAYNAGNYELALGEFVHWAKKNDGEAAFYASKMYAEGKGVPSASEHKAKLYEDKAKKSGYKPRANDIRAEASTARKEDVKPVVVEQVPAKEVPVVAEQKPGKDEAKPVAAPVAQKEALPVPTQEPKSMIQERLRDINDSMPAALKEMKPAAKKGPCDGLVGVAAYNQGMKLMGQKSTQLDEMLICLDVAAASNYPQAALVLGKIFSDGELLKADYQSAQTWFYAAAGAGVPEAAYRLGLMYEKGRGVVANIDEATHLYEEAAQAGYAPAAVQLGSLYATGAGVAPDYQKAHQFFRIAAEKGDSSAQFGIGVLFHKGLGVPQSYKQAGVWYRKASERRHSGALNNLGFMAELGQGGNIDYVAAHEWFNLAAAFGEPAAADNRARVEQKMTTEQVNRAQAAAADWLTKFGK